MSRTHPEIRMKACLASIGCLALIVLLLVAGGIGYGGLKMKRFREQAEATQARLEATDAAFPFAAAPDARLDSARFATFQAVRERVARPIAAIVEKFGAVERTVAREAGPIDSFRAMFGFVTEAAGSFHEIHEQLAAELTARSMSWGEFRWIARRALETLLAAARDGDAEATRIVAELENAQTDFRAGAESPFGSFSDLRRELERDAPAWHPADLAVILGATDAYAKDPSALLLDVWAIRMQSN